MHSVDPSLDGVPPADATPEVNAQRGDAALLFVDVVSYTPFAERHAPGDVLRVLSAYFRAVTAPVIRPNGAGAPSAFMTVVRLLTALTLAVPVASSQDALPADSSANTRRAQAEAVVDRLTAGEGQPALGELRRHFPFLADATTDYALGDVWGRSVLDDRTRQLATVAAFAATGHLGVMTTHAGYALNLGVSPDELREVVYLTTVHSGFPRAIDAAVALGALFDERGVAPTQPPDSE